MTWGILWFLCAFAAGLIAQTKGRGAFRWFIIGLALGPVGTALALGQEPTDAEERRRALDGNNSTVYRACPACGEVIRRTAQVCPTCQRDIAGKQ